MQFYKVGNGVPIVFKNRDIIDLMNNWHTENRDKRPATIQDVFMKKVLKKIMSFALAAATAATVSISAAASGTLEQTYGESQNVY